MIEFYNFHKALIIKKAPPTGGALSNLLPMKLSPPVLMTVGALSFTAGQGTDAVYTPERGRMFKIFVKKLLFFVNDGYRGLVDFV